ncbi:MAG: isochorismatase family protein [Candidatus Tyrphobacter sp.]
MYRLEETDALLVVDPQNDFLPGGSLAVPDGNRIFDPINRLMPLFSYVVGSRDWHPRHHAYFQAYGGPWPFHCIQGTAGAEFSPLLHADEVDEIVDKGTDPNTDGYSAFAGTMLARRLRERGIRRIFIAGLATDYCVKNTVLDAADAGFSTVVVTDAVAAIDLEPGDEARALHAMRERGAEFCDSHAIVRS